jgi:hypothetical protein
MKVDAYVKTMLTVIAVAVVAIAAHLWGARVSPTPAHAQTPSSALEQRIAALEQTQEEQAQRLEALRSALQSTVTNATGRGYFPDRNWAPIHWYPAAAPTPGS